MINTPVLFIVFNRPDLTRQVLARIRDAQPKQLFIAADGPREKIEGEGDLCQQCRNEVVNGIDWDCEVKTLFQGINLGCGFGPVAAINWFFENVEQGIILEDDCLPSSCFFRFCEQMLNLYRNDTRVMSISGTNILSEWKASIYAYFFSYYGGNWGWATWKRAWQKFDPAMKLWRSDENKKYIEYILGDRTHAQRLGEWFDSAIGKESDIWDFQWFYSRLINSGLSIVPVKNLISNIGFVPEATHTKEPGAFSNLPLYEMEVPVAQNPIVVVDRDFDRETAKLYQLTGEPNYALQIMSRISTFVKKHGVR